MIHVYVLYIYVSTQFQDKFLRRALVQPHVLVLLVGGDAWQKILCAKESPVPPAQLAGVTGVTARYAAME